MVQSIGPADIDMDFEVGLDEVGNHERLTV
jgi:hypothetical protein